MAEWFFLLRRSRLGRGYVFVALLLLVAATALIVSLGSTPPGVLTFAVLDIGQGDSLYIESPSGVRVLLDGGPQDAVLTALPNVLPLFARSLDAVIESHPDADHVGGLVPVLNRYEVGAFIAPGIVDTTATSRALEKEVSQEHIPRFIARRGMSLDLGGGARLDILYPDREVAHIHDTNEGSIVARLVYGQTSVLLTGDAPKDVESHLIGLEGQDGKDELGSTILKVGHHGSKNSTAATFVAAVHPALAVISVGAGNKYGHPTQEVLSTLGAAKVPIERTDKEGTLVFRSDGEHFWRVR